MTVTKSTEVLMAGFGGQGMLVAGKILAHAAMDRGLEVSWLPSYGPEMRGGTANVIVCIAEEPIGSPLISSPRGLLVMNLPSLEKFAPRVKPGGVIVVNSSLVERDPERPDCTVVQVPARELAIGAGADRASNLVMLGTYVGVTAAVDVDALETAIRNEFSGRKEKFAAPSVAAFRAGLAAGTEARDGVGAGEGAGR